MHGKDVKRVFYLYFSDQYFSIYKRESVIFSVHLKSYEYKNCRIFAVVRFIFIA